MLFLTLASKFLTAGSGKDVGRVLTGSCLYGGKVADLMEGGDFIMADLLSRRN